MTISVQLIIISVSLMIGVPVITVALMHSGMVKRIFSCHKEQETDGGGDGQDELPEVGRRFVEILGSMQVSCEELPKADGVDRTVSFEYQGGHFLPRSVMETTIRLTTPCPYHTSTAFRCRPRIWLLRSRWPIRSTGCHCR